MSFKLYHRKKTSVIFILSNDWSYQQIASSLKLLLTKITQFPWMSLLVQWTKKPFSVGLKTKYVTMTSIQSSFLVPFFCCKDDHSRFCERQCSLIKSFFDSRESYSLDGRAAGQLNSGWLCRILSGDVFDACGKKGLPIANSIAHVA